MFTEKDFKTRQCGIILLNFGQWEASWASHYAIETKRKPSNENIFKAHVYEALLSAKKMASNLNKTLLWTTLHSFGEANYIYDHWPGLPSSDFRTPPILKAYSEVSKEINSIRLYKENLLPLFLRQLRNLKGIQ